MSRARISVADLASEAGLGEERVLDLLRQVGIRIDSARGYVPRSQTALAREVISRARVRRLRLPAGGAATTRRPENEAAKPESAVVPTLAPLKWKHVGHKQALRFLTADELDAIHWQIADDFAQDDDPIEPPGVRSRALLESSAFRPQTSHQGVGKYPTAAMAGSALFYAVVHNHPFHNGNKRTALVSLIAFLDRNGWVLHAEEDELFEYVLLVAQHRVVRRFRSVGADRADEETLAISQWLHSRMRKLKKEEFRLQFRALRKILASFGCELDVKSGNRINIRRDGLKTQVFYSGDGMDVDVNAIHKIRRDLHLDDDHGCDSERFYGSAPDIPEFISRYRKILKRLAEYDRAEARNASSV